MKKILLIDDNEIYVYGFETLVSNNKNIKIIHKCVNGSQALRFLERNSSEINLILIDMSIRKKEEITAVKIIKEKYPDIKVIVNSAYPKNICQELCSEVNVDGYTSKLEDLDSFFNVLLE